MTDEQMDARLRGAGSAWRVANAVAVEPIEATPAQRTRRWLLPVAAAVVTAALVTGGLFAFDGSPGRPNADDGSGAPLRGTVWQLVDGPAGKHSGATLSIDRTGHLVADDSCQVIGARARIAAARVTFSDQVVRFKSCTDSVGETVFTRQNLKMLRGDTSYRISGTELTISAAGHAMHLRVANTAAPSLDVPTFVGARWRLVGARALGHPVDVTSATPLRIDDHGKLVAGDGCNGLTAVVHGQSGRVRITRTGFQTEIGCPTAGAVDSVLDGTVQESVVNGTLTISKPGYGELIYRWQPNSAATDPKHLTGATWRLVTIGADRAAGNVTLRIAADGRMSGSDGCLPLVGKVALDRGTADLRRYVGLGARCENPSVRGEATTVNSFLRGGTIVWAIRDGRLLIYGGDAQSFALVFRRQ